MTPTLPTTVVPRDVTAGMITTMTVITTTTMTTTTTRMALVTELLPGTDKAAELSTSWKVIRIT